VDDRASQVFPHEVDDVESQIDELASQPSIRAVTPQPSSSAIATLKGSPGKANGKTNGTNRKRISGASFGISFNLTTPLAGSDSRTAQSPARQVASRGTPLFAPGSTSPEAVSDRESSAEPPPKVSARKGKPTSAPPASQKHNRLPSFGIPSSSQPSSSQLKRRDTVGHSLSLMSQTYQQRRGNRSRTASLPSTTLRPVITRAAVARQESDESSSSSSDDAASRTPAAKPASSQVPQHKRAGSAKPVLKRRKSISALWSQG
jgi:hypothetical protein